MKIGIICILLFCANIALWAHDPSEVTYRFKHDELTIHLTPKGSLDLLSIIKPGLSDQESLRLSDYVQDYEKYFNHHIEITKADTVFNLKYLSSDLTQHDSYIRFRLIDFDGQYEAVTIIVTAFEEVYRGIQNHIIRPDESFSNQTGFQVLKEPFIEYSIPYWSYLLYFSFAVITVFQYWKYSK